MGQKRVELLTPALSERCSNQLSYCPRLLLLSGKKKEIKTLHDGVSYTNTFTFLIERR